MDISYLTLWITLHCDLKLPLIFYLPIQELTWSLHLFWILYIDNINIKQRRGKGDRQQIINFNHKGQHKTGCYPKSLLKFIAYQFMGSRPIYPFRSHSPVHSENNSYFVGIGPIHDVELTCKFRPEFPLCT